MPAVTFEKLSAIVSNKLDRKSAQNLEQVAATTCEEVLSVASPAMRQAAGLVRERVGVRLRDTDAAAAPSGRRLRVMSDILVAREVARVDFGVDLLIAQP